MTMRGGDSVSLLAHMTVAAVLIVAASAKCITLDKSDSTTASFFDKFNGVNVTGDRQEYYSYVYYKNDTLLLGSSDTVYKVNPTSFQRIWALNIGSVDDVPGAGYTVLSCTILTPLVNQPVYCRNQISLIEEIATDRWLVCGTNSMKPACWYCDESSPNESWTCTLAVDIPSVKRFVPSRPEFDSSWIYDEESGKAFAGTQVPSHEMSYFQELDATSNFSPVLGNDPHQENWLNTPAFVGDPIEHEGYIYFFFREVATEYMNAGKIVYSRVGRVCANDNATRPTSFEEKFQTMVKARLNCSIDLDFPFYFNEIQDTFISKREDNEQIIYAVFTTPWSGPPASAVCAYSLSEIESLFNDHARYKGQSEPGFDWLPRSHGSFGSSERFGQCGIDYTTNEQTRIAVNNYNLVDQLVPNLRNVKKTSVNVERDSDSPILYLNNYRFTSIAEVADGGPIVLMIGTDRGSILKTTFSPGMAKGEYGHKIAEIMLDNEGNRVRDIAVLVGGTHILVTAISGAFRVNIEFCNIYTTCEDCRRVMDPHCYWNDDTNTCLSSAELQTDIPPVDTCQVYGGSDHIDEVKSFGMEQSAAEGASHPVNEYSLIIAKKGRKLRVECPTNTNWICNISSGATPETEFYAIRLSGESSQINREVAFNVSLDDVKVSNITAAVTKDNSATCDQRQAGAIYTYDCDLAKYEFKMAKIRQDMLKACATGANAGGVYQCPSPRFEGDSDSYTCPAF